MYLKSMTIDGFKSYGQRTEIAGFDPLFNAITGLNGSGKSNILDAICFLLGITNLSHVRATNLQELVYKNGQAGITKATVTITFDNSDKNQSPIGLEHYNEIVITRQIVIGGRNKYMLNGSTVQNSRIQDIFRSVQLNVNNPHFLIMQGRITKVLNMKPPEILAMIEEAAGTRMYESKKQQAQKTIEKKDSKLKEINDLLQEEITPTLSKLKEERTMYLEYQKVQRELEHLTKLYTAYKFVSTKKDWEKAKQEHQNIEEKIDDLQHKTTEKQQLVKDLENQIIQLQKIRDEQTGGELHRLEDILKEKERAEVKASASFKNGKEVRAAEEKKLKQLVKSLDDDKKVFELKQKEAGKLQGMYDQMRKNDADNKASLAQAEKRFEAISSGKFSAEDGAEATLQEQLINASASITSANTETKQAEMQLKHCKESLKKKQTEMKQTKTQFDKDKMSVDVIEKKVKNLEVKLNDLNYDDKTFQELQNRRQQLNHEVISLQNKIGELEARYPQLCFEYEDPERNFDRNRVKGLVCKLIKLKDVSTATALEVTAGGRLYNVIVDTDETAKKLIERGKLRTRVTFIPLSKVLSRAIQHNIVQRAKSLVEDPNQVDTALSLIEYDKENEAAMKLVFGSTFVCSDMNTAKRVAFDKGVNTKSITLGGEVYDPAGTLSGGSRSQRGSILGNLHDMDKTFEELNNKTQQLNAINAQLQDMQKRADVYSRLKQEYDLQSNELKYCQQRLQQTSHFQLQEEVNTLQQTMNDCEETLVRCKKQEADGKAKVKELEAKIKDAKNTKEKELQAARKHLDACRKKAEESAKQWSDKEQDEEALKLEINGLENSIKVTEEQIDSTRRVLEENKEELAQLEQNVKEAKETVKEAQDVVKRQKEALSCQNKEINSKTSKKDKTIEEINQGHLDIKKLNHELDKAAADAKEAENKVAAMYAKYEWISEDEQFFDHPNTGYDFSANDPQEAGRKISKLEEAKTKLSKNVNMRAMNMLGKAEEQYNDLMRRKRIVENDKAKIEKVIQELDEKKKAALRQAWEQVNKDFGSIFSMLLPGTQAQLMPPEGMDVLEGLEVKVAFGDVWKESLNELSGGQRSLVALSLILALLLFKPAPIYILDEVDAALDLSHTQNIGHMLRTHFKHSQFIVVSLKDGMFNNANVLFKTKFIDGMSTVSRQTQHANATSKRK